MNALTKKSKELLIEAMRRWLMKNNPSNKVSTAAWLGLGSKTEYNPAARSGLMKPVYGLKTRTIGWWTLTPKGAKIVQKWIDKGIKSDHFNDFTLPFDPDKFTK